MIDINQVQRDFDNGVMLCRETIRQVIELAVNQQAVACFVCGENSPRTGTCGSRDPRALCNLSASKDSSCG